MPGDSCNNVRGWLQHVTKYNICQCKQNDYYQKYNNNITVLFIHQLDE